METPFKPDPAIGRQQNLTHFIAFFFFFFFKKKAVTTRLRKMTTHPNGKRSNYWVQFSAVLISVAVSFWVPKYKFIRRSNFPLRRPWFIWILGRMKSI